eukprot:TRINITY_DN26582_c0_g1_i1.p1 TRINITY_DN26582_c0_g1~~TRINITY_DN26582_c0_g1_i1.p1  ORF type:complete len:393 (-),score=40.99 TRINITY_DN26582_c0_g1_i1:15-1193(-)
MRREGVQQAPATRTSRDTYATAANAAHWQSHSGCGSSQASSSEPNSGQHWSHRVSLWQHQMEAGYGGTLNAGGGALLPPPGLPAPNATTPGLSSGAGRLPLSTFLSEAIALGKGSKGSQGPHAVEQQNQWLSLRGEHSNYSNSSTSAVNTDSHSESSVASVGMAGSDYSRSSEGDAASSDYSYIQEQMYEEFAKQAAAYVGHGGQEGYQVVQANMVMMKNMPYRCTKPEVLDAVHALGFPGTYVFFCLPLRRNRKQNYGFACISFVDQDTMIAFCKAMDGYCFTTRKSTKVVSVAPATFEDAFLNFSPQRRCDVSEAAAPQVPAPWPPQESPVAGSWHSSYAAAMAPPSGHVPPPSGAMQQQSMPPRQQRGSEQPSMEPFAKEPLEYKLYSL